MEVLFSNSNLWQDPPFPQVEDGHKPSLHLVDVLLVLQAFPDKPLNSSRISLLTESLCWEMVTSGDPQHDDVLLKQPALSC